MTTIKALLKAGLLNEGDILIWSRRTKEMAHEATIQGNGLIETKDKIKHKTPSGAAKHLNNNKPVDGWIAWKVKNSGEKLSSLRSKLGS